MTAAAGGSSDGSDDHEESRPDDTEGDHDTSDVGLPDMPHGTYHGRGWTVDVGADAGSLTVTIASMHEAMHERLQVTTVYGCVVTLLERLAVHDPLGPWTARGGTLRRGYPNVHEQFATWMSAVPARWDRRRIAGDFPRYLRYFDRAGARLANIPSPYLAMHAMQAVARACMQPAALAELALRDITRITPAGLDRTTRPDHRLRVLDRLLVERGFGPVAEYAGPAAELSMDQFADENDEEWTDLNRTAYRWCAGLLDEAGCPTLPYDGHLDAVRAATADAVAHVGAPIGVAVGAAEKMSTTDVGLFAVESEQISLGPPLPTLVHPLVTDPGVMLAGDTGRAHLFLAIRPRRNVLAQYAIDASRLSARDHLAVLRCSTDDGVELLDVSDRTPEEISAGRAVVVSVSMRSLADHQTRAHWAALLNRTSSTVLVDLRPSQHLPRWLDDPRRRLHWTIFGAGTPRGNLRILAFELRDPDGAASRLHLAPVSALTAAGFQLWLDQTPDLRDRVVADDTLADGPLVRFTIAHLTTEERHFDFHAGETHA